MISPKSNSDMIGTVFYPKKNSGKIQKGQKIVLRFDSYNPNHFGIVYEKINQVSTIVDSLGVSFFFPKDTLVTNTGHIIPFHQGISGQAEIITEDLSLFARVVYPVRRILE